MNSLLDDGMFCLRSRVAIAREKILENLPGQGKVR